MTAALERGRMEGGRRTLEPGPTREPLVSVVTVVLNGREVLEKTILSVLGQSCPDLEYIVIDGGSGDGTLELIKKYQERIDYWLSEPDRGIYHAMNKGIALARGRWISFMNAGDCFYEPQSLERARLESRDQADLVYGDCGVQYPGGQQRVQPAGSPGQLWKGMVCSHQSMFVKSALLKERPFDTAIRLCADFDLIFAAYREQRVFQKLDQVVALIDAGGVSDLRRREVLAGKWRIVRRSSPSLALDLYYLAQLLDASLRGWAKRLLPAGATRYLQMRKGRRPGGKR